MSALLSSKKLVVLGLFLLLAACLLTGCAHQTGAAQSVSDLPTTSAGQTALTAPSLDNAALAGAGECSVESSDCGEATVTEEAPTSTAQAPDSQPLLDETPASTPEPEPRPTLGPDDWQDYPVIPSTMSEHARAIYQQGLLAGNDPRHFSKIGDCQNINTYFLALYDDPSAYTLGDEYSALQGTIDQFSGMWSRDSISVKGGFNVANIFNPWFNNKELCGSNETPIDCELRVNKPSIVLISMEAWWNGDPARYATYYRRIVETVLAYNALPILATKADNLEGNHEINRSIVQIAYEYDVPVWNFWRAVQDIPEHGLEEDGFHITHGINDFSNPDNLERAWPLRNLTALQAINAVYQALQQP
jgi:hypothetical protein